MALSMMVRILTPLNRLQVNALLDHLPQWTHLPQLPHTPTQLLNRVLNLLLGREPADSDPQ